MAVNVPTIVLNDGKAAPAIALGTWRVDTTKLPAAIDAALAAGYLHFDCAPIYKNQRIIGSALSAAMSAGVTSRNKLYITTKVPPTDSSPEYVLPSLRASLEELQMEYVDQFLIVRAQVARRAPRCKPRSVSCSTGQRAPVPVAERLGYSEAMLVETWRELEKAVDAGSTRSIGVSNCSARKLTALMDHPETSVNPSMNQLEMHAYLPQDDLLAWHAAAGIAVTGYSVLGSPGRPDAYRAPDDAPDLLTNEHVVAVAARAARTPAQVLLRWAVQRGVIPISRSMTPSRLVENVHVFDFALSEEDMQALAHIGRGAHGGFRWNKGEHMAVEGQDWRDIWDEAWTAEWAQGRRQAAATARA